MANKRAAREGYLPAPPLPPKPSHDAIPRPPTRSPKTLHFPIKNSFPRVDLLKSSKSKAEKTDKKIFIPKLARLPKPPIQPGDQQSTKANIRNDLTHKPVPPAPDIKLAFDRAWADSFSDDFTSSEEENVYEPPLNECQASRIQQSINSREESEVFTPPLLPAPRQASQSSSLSSFHSSSTDIGDRDGGSGCTHSGSLSDVEAEPWFFNISRREAEVYLRKCADGTYLVRPSRKGGHGSICTLNVQFGGRVYHVLVQRRDDGNVGLGTEKEGEETFTSIVELVEYYQEKRLQLFSNGNLVGTTALTCYFKSPA